LRFPPGSSHPDNLLPHHNMGRKGAGPKLHRRVQALPRVPPAAVSRQWLPAVWIGRRLPSLLFRRGRPARHRSMRIWVPSSCTSSSSCSPFGLKSRFFDASASVAPGAGTQTRPSPSAALLQRLQVHRFGHSHGPHFAGAGEVSLAAQAYTTGSTCISC
jgi:hypothetical protein